MQELTNIIGICTEYNRIKLINSSCNNNSKENITVILMQGRKHKFPASKQMQVYKSLVKCNVRITEKVL